MTTNTLPIGEAARAIGVAVETIRRWEAGGKIKSVRTPSGHRRFAAAEVARVKAERSPVTNGDDE